MTSIHSSAHQPGFVVDAQHGFQQDGGTVSVPRGQYRDLVKIAHQYANLCQNLITGGVDNRTLQLLSSQVSTSQTSHTPTARDTSNGNVRPGPSSKPFKAPSQTEVRPISPERLQRSEKYGGQWSQPTDWVDTTSFHDGESVSSDNTPAAEVQETTHTPAKHQQQRPSFERHAERSVQLANLADGTTHSDITAVVRGGVLLDVYLRSKDRIAAVSFVHADDANAFYEHAQKNGLYIKNKRVDIKWNERQYVLPGYLAQKIGDGATRNLIIRGHDHSNTKKSIRDDLEHIHNLTVVKIEIIGENCCISTNSVSNAMFARTCMMSRLKYKGSRIEWDTDECAQPLVRTPVPQRHTPAVPVGKSAMNPLANRFEVLAMDC